MAGQNNFFSEEPLYSIDTSTVIVLRQFYPADVFETLHQLIIPIFKSGKILVVNSVLEELKSSEQDLYNFIIQTVPKERQEKYEDHILTAQRIVQTYYDGKGKSHNIKADPHVISCAKDEGLTVITEELGSDPTKMPYICSREGVTCINFIDFLKKERIKN